MLRLAPSHENRLTGKLATVGKVEIVEGEEKEEVEAGEEKGMGKVAEMEEAARVLGIYTPLFVASAACIAISVLFNFETHLFAHKSCVWICLVVDAAFKRVLERFRVCFVARVRLFVLAVFWLCETTEL